MQIVATDTGAPINVIATDEQGQPFSLQTATSVVLNVLFPDGVTRKSFPLTVQSATLKDDVNATLANPYFWAQYKPAATDLTVGGSYTCQAVATFSGGTISTARFTLLVETKV